MSTAQAVTQHLPFLRRYARALTGSQQSGDVYVTTALEALIADPSVDSRPAPVVSKVVLMAAKLSFPKARRKRCWP